MSYETGHPNIQSENHAIIREYLRVEKAHDRRRNELRARPFLRRLGSLGLKSEIRRHADDLRARRERNPQTLSSPNISAYQSRVRQLEDRLESKAPSSQSDFR